MTLRQLEILRLLFRQSPNARASSRPVASRNPSPRTLEVLAGLPCSRASTIGFWRKRPRFPKARGSRGRAQRFEPVRVPPFPSACLVARGSASCACGNGRDRRCGLPKTRGPWHGTQFGILAAAAGGA